MAESRFRLDNEVLAFRFTATTIDRATTCRELLVKPGDLVDWLAIHALRVDGATEKDLQAARAMREAVHRIGTAVADGRRPTPRDVQAINQAARTGRARLELDRALTCRWTVPEGRFAVRDALGVLAHDAIEQLARHADRVRTCEDAACRGLFVDTSRAGSRRWCSMNYCGNRNKKQNLRHGGRRRTP